MARAERLREAPDIPTFRELGFDLIASASRGIVGPPGIPEPIAARLRDAFGAGMADPVFLRDAERQVMPLRPVLGEEYRAMAAGVDAQLRALWQRRPWRG
jgi:tripartite-type tricarboxylate transporter receptor subunit TctC